MDTNLDATLDKLITANVCVVGKDENKTDDDLWVTLSAEERRTGRETFDFYCFLIWPFVESYFLSCVSLYTLLPDLTNPSELHWIDSRVFIDRSQIFGKTLYYEGDVSYIESVNKETIVNAIGWFKQLGIIYTHRGAEPPVNSCFEPSSLSTNSNTTWIALVKEWVPLERLPEVEITQPDNFDAFPSKSRKDWDGPLGFGHFASSSVKSIYDAEPSITISKKLD